MYRIIKERIANGNTFYFSNKKFCDQNYSKKNNKKSRCTQVISDQNSNLYACGT